jgi:predicted homoserine dehydrogenase-like protein
MNLHEGLRRREADGTPVRVGIIGAGRFGTMFLAHVHTTPGIHVVGIADLNVSRAREALRLAEWPQDEYASNLQETLRSRTTAVLDDATELIEAPLDVIVEATGNPVVGIDHALRTIDAGHDIVMVNVEADALAGPALAARARSAGVVYSLAYGDQPALIWEQIDWARTSGFELVCAGKGAKYLPHYHELNPGNVWDAWEFSPELTGSGQLSPTMHTSFRDGTKAAIEMAAVANAAGLHPADGGLKFPPASTSDLARICRPVEDGGTLERWPTVEVVSSVDLAGNWLPDHLQEGVFVVVKAPNAYVRACMAEYAWKADDTHQYVALYRTQHFVGLELNVTIASAALRREATGMPTGFTADVVAVTKKPLQAGDVLDGEGGYAVWGKLTPAELSLTQGALPIGLAHRVPLVRDVAEGEVVTWDDVAIDDGLLAVAIRKETEALCVAV